MTIERRLCLAAALGLFVVSAIPAMGQPVNEDFKLTAPVPIEEDQFGRSVGISGTTAIVGAPETFFTGASPNLGRGAAYLFDTRTGAQLIQLISNDAATFDEFGLAVAISGTTAIVTAPGADDQFGAESGAAYLFDTTNGTQIGKLLPSDSASVVRFGTSVAISGTIAIVGNESDSSAGFFSGSAYLFDISDSSIPAEIAKLTAPNAMAFDNFGGSVAISDTIAIVGVRGDDEKGSDAGAAYLFDAQTGDQIAKITANDAAPFAFFGFSVAIDGTNAFVGAPGDGDAGASSGSVYLFNISNPAEPVQVAKLTASDAGAGDVFGSSVAISESTAIVGARNNNTSGSAYMFDVADASSPVEIAKLISSDAADFDEFGFSIAVSGTAAIVGAVGDSDAGFFAGSAYLFNTAPSPADLNNDGTLDFFDISIFLNAFNNQDPLADFNGDGIFDFFDVAAFIVAFGRG